MFYIYILHMSKTYVSNIYNTYKNRYIKHMCFFLIKSWTHVKYIWNICDLIHVLNIRWYFSCLRVFERELLFVGSWDMQMFCLEPRKWNTLKVQAYATSFSICKFYQWTSLFIYRKNPTQIILFISWIAIWSR